jgi:hypothetical protein
VAFSPQLTRICDGLSRYLGVATVMLLSGDFSAHPQTGQARRIFRFVGSFCLTCAVAYPGV